MNVIDGLTLCGGGIPPVGSITHGSLRLLPVAPAPHTYFLPPPLISSLLLRYLSLSVSLLSYIPLHRRSFAPVAPRSGVCLGCHGWRRRSVLWLAEPICRSERRPLPPVVIQLWRHLTEEQKKKAPAVGHRPD